MKNNRVNTEIVLFDKTVDKFFGDKLEMKYLNQFYIEES